MELKEFIKQVHPKVFFEYERFKNYKFEMLKPGTQLLMLRSGFCGGVGVIRAVSSLKNGPAGEYAELVGGDGVSLLYKSGRDPWWRECYVFSGEEERDMYKDMSRKDQVIWQINTLGFVL